MDERKKILWRSLFLTILIFAIGIMLNHVFDSFRISIIETVMTEHEISSESYRAERFFTETFGGDTCEIMVTRISDLKKEIRKVGEDLGTYSRFSFFRRKDYDYLKRKYFLLEFRFLALIQRLNQECDKPYLPIIFFYEIDDDASERQGFILQDLSEEYDQHLVVLNLDKDYTDEPLVSLLAKNYNVTTAPTLIIDGMKHEGLIYTGEINASIQKVFRRADPYTQNINFNITTTAAGTNTTKLLELLERTANDEKADNWARADAKLVIGRLTKNETQICESLAYYDKIKPQTPEEQALIYETSASMGCGRNREAFLRAAAQAWKTAGNNWRAELMERLAKGKLNLKFEPKTIEPALKNATSAIIGKTTITLNSSSLLVSQEDRVYRDWLGGQIANPYGPELLTTFSERLNYNTTELMPEIGWHEGARIKELQKTNLTHKTAVGTLVARKNGEWYAPDENGIFRFEVPIDKLSYPTTRFLRRDLAVIIDTHGINMMVDQAIRENATAVIGCCDSPSKVQAAEYLSEKGTAVICLTDKDVYLALGHNTTIAGSPPIEVKEDKAIIGNRPIKITQEDRIVALNATEDKYALWYYQSPAAYFEELSKAIPLQVEYVTINDFGQMEKATQKARETKATILATRVFNSQDYNAVKKWLDEDPERKVILFHSASYPYGQKIFQEYTSATFNDPNPILR
ncbi:hypothetical protein KY319_01980 [Candidatus Woesearchaeota archaeon]|nr:hypothetical protein [Candidatus Woesearchaeota archaeon]